MLKLKRVDIQGFKSFYDRTDMKFHGSGIAAIVGPNGCGKSNIVDAIRWVLGEQSAKSLRAGAMQDVIFAGSDRRKQLPQCEVELIFADCEKELGTAFAEVSVMRRIYREGTSDYFLNGKPARLKDIRCPTLAIAGEQDASAPTTRYLGANIPGARTVMIPGAAHISNVERPDAFTRALREFLRAG